MPSDQRSLFDLSASPASTSSTSASSTSASSPGAADPTRPVCEIEHQAISQTMRVIIGVDEAGRGPLARPVHAAAVALVRLDEPDALSAHWMADLDDSKRLTEARREALYDPIKAHALAWHVASRERDVIDRDNILQATFQCMVEAIEAVTAQLAALGLTPDRVYIDGNQKAPFSGTPQTTVVKGDSRSLHIAAASILAKVSRDRLMVEHDARWPAYGFAQHKGYGTKVHRAAIAAHGPCPIHRLSFGGVREHVRP